MEDEDHFTYMVSDGGHTNVSATVLVKPYSLPAPNDRTVELDEDGMAWVSLALPGYDLTMLEVVVITPPERGELYHAGLVEASDSSDNMDDAHASYSDLPTLKSDPLLSAVDQRISPGDVVNNLRGVVQFFPFPDEFEPNHYTNFTYVLQDRASGVRSAQATIVFVVNSVNDAPTGQALNVSVPVVDSHATSGSTSIQINLGSYVLYRRHVHRCCCLHNRYRFHHHYRKYHHHHHNHHRLSVMISTTLSPVV